MFDNFRAFTKALYFFSCDSELVISVPLKPVYAYDLVIDSNEGIKKVKIIRTDAKAPSGTYVVNLRKSGGYKNKKELKQPFDSNMCDLIFVDSPIGSFLIPTPEITSKRAISLSQYLEYKIDIAS